MANEQKETKELSALEKAQEKLAQVRREVVALRNLYTLKGAKVSVNKVYAELYKQDKTEEEKLKIFWAKVDEVKKQYIKG